MLPLCPLLVKPSVSFGQLYWDVNGANAGAGGPTANGAWDTGTTSNWTTDSTGSSATAVWTAHGTAIFSAGSDATGTATVNIHGNANAASGITLKDGNVTFNNDGTTLSGLALDAATTLNLAAGHTLNLGNVPVAGSTVTLTGGGTLSTNNSAGVFTASSLMTVTGGSTLALGSRLFYGSTGNVLLNNGTLKSINPATGSNAGSLINATNGIQIGSGGGTIYWDHVNSVDFTTVYGPNSGIAITGSGNTLTKAGDGEFRYQGAGVTSTTFAKLVVQNGLYRVGASGLSANQGDLAFGAVPGSPMSDQITLGNQAGLGVSLATTLSATRGITLATGSDNNNAFFSLSATMTIPGNITGQGGINLGGGFPFIDGTLYSQTAQTLSLSGSNSYTGSTVISLGTIQASSTTAIPTNSSVVFPTASLALVFKVSSASSIGSLSSLASGGGSVTLGADLTVGNDNSNTTFSGAISAINGVHNFTKVGTGTFTLTPAANSLTGPMNINGGTVSISDGSALGIGSVSFDNAATLATTAAITIANNVTLNSNGGGTINIGANAVELSGTIQGAGGITQTGGGTLTLSGFASHTGTTHTLGGTLKAGAANAFSPSSAHVIEAPATLDMNGQDQTIGSLAGAGTALVSANLTTGGDGTTTTFTGPLTGTGTLIKTGAGTMHVTNFNLGGLNINGGGILHVLPSGRSAASTSVLTSAPVIDSASQLDIEDNAMIVNYDASDTTHSVRDNIRNLLKNGRNGAAGQPGAWNGLGGITSSFAHNNGNGFNLAIGYGDNEDIALVRGSGSYTSFGGQTVASNTVLVQMTRGADATLDGVVDAQDVTILGSHFNKPNSGQWVFGDFDYSGTCDATDVTTLGSTFGKTTPTLSPAQMTAEFGAAFTSAFEGGRAGAVPEPASLTLLGLGGVALMARRSRKRRMT